jgi:hypothetical protein
MEATFDVRFAELQAKIQAVVQMLIDEFPAAAVRAREIIAQAVDVAAVQAEFAADEARANALGALIDGTGQMLAAVEAPTPDPEPEGV